MTVNFNIENAYRILLITLGFLLPLTVFGANLIVVIICLLWLFSGSYKSKFIEIIKSKLMLASIFFFLLHLIGLLWTSDLAWGFHIVHKMWYFLLLFPILFTIVKREDVKYYIVAFLLAMVFSQLISYLVWFELLPPFQSATVINPTPFMSHISYNPILAFSIYLILHKIFFNQKLTRNQFFLCSFFAMVMVFNMFITGGRAGQVMFFVMLGILLFQVFGINKFKSLLASFLLLPAIFFSAYQVSDQFSSRVDEGVSDLMLMAVSRNTSIGQRYSFAINSMDMLEGNLLFGVGTGDYPMEYKRINELNLRNMPFSPNTGNPHNMYILVLSQLGLIGLISLLSIFYYQIKLSFNSPNKFIRDVGITLPLLILLIMLSDSYLLGHFTTLMYVFFSSFLYKDFEKN
jgi:O-antigen ligase